MSGINLPYYNRQGEEITNDEWMKLFTDKKYKIVKQTNVHGNKVSTVWLGTDHSFGGSDDIVIFETLVFGDGMWDDYGRRWTTEDHALLGHSVICDAITWWYMKQIGIQEWVRVRDPSVAKSESAHPVDEAHNPSAVDHYVRRTTPRMP